MNVRRSFSLALSIVLTGVVGGSAVADEAQEAFDLCAQSAHPLTDIHQKLDANGWVVQTLSDAESIAALNADVSFLVGLNSSAATALTEQEIKERAPGAYAAELNSRLVLYQDVLSDTPTSLFGGSFSAFAKSGTVLLAKESGSTSIQILDCTIISESSVDVLRLLEPLGPSSTQRQTGLTTHQAVPDQLAEGVNALQASGRVVDPDFANNVLGKEITAQSVLYVSRFTGNR